MAIKAMRWAAVVCLLCFGLTGAVIAQSSVAPADRAAIRSVISQQLEAFRRDDGTAAFAFASPGIQAQFGSPERFLDMVSRAYPTVHRAAGAEFAELLTKDGTVVQQVELTGAGGEAELALYSMERDAAGQWRISGCTLVRSTRVGV